ncbi:interleukin-3-like [Vulpes vulpes]|uniref:Interleukin-3-like n=1 Tax=Vulpes vulpes TaxID=9627 RepID=A0ABM4YC77_VULVU
MWTSLCLQLLIFLPFSLSRSLLSVTPGDQEQACCEYWSTIPEIYYKLNITSTTEDFNLRLELEKDTLLKSNLAAFRNISEKFFSVSNASLSINKNLEKLENLLQTLPMPMPTPQREVYIQAEDFNEFSEKLKIFLEALDDFLKPLLKCPGTFKASCKKS